MTVVLPSTGKKQSKAFGDVLAPVGFQKKKFEYIHISRDDRVMNGHIIVKIDKRKLPLSNL